MLAATMSSNQSYCLMELAWKQHQKTVSVSVCEKASIPKWVLNSFRMYKLKKHPSQIDSSSYLEGGNIFNPCRWQDLDHILCNLVVVVINVVPRSCLLLDMAVHLIHRLENIVKLLISSCLLWWTIQITWLTSHYVRKHTNIFDSSKTVTVQAKWPFFYNSNWWKVLLNQVFMWAQKRYIECLN